MREHERHPAPASSRRRCLRAATSSLLVAAALAGCATDGDFGDEAAATPAPPAAGARAATPVAQTTRWTALPGAPELLDLKVARNLDGSQAFFGLTTDGAVVYAQEQGAGGPFGAIVSLGGSGLRNLRVAPNADGRLEVFALGGDQNNVWHRWQTAASTSNFSAWRAEFLYDTRDLQVVSYADGTLEMLVLTGGSGVQRKKQNGPNLGWGDWSAVGAGGLELRLITAARQADGKIVLMGLDHWGVTFVSRQPTPGVWSQGWTTLGGSLVQKIELGMTPAGQLDVLGIGGDNNLYHLPQTEVNGWFAPWQGMNGAYEGSAFGTTFVRDAYGFLDAFVTNGGHTVTRLVTGNPAAAWIAGPAMNAPGAHGWQAFKRDDRRLVLWTIGADWRPYWTAQSSVEGPWAQLPPPPNLHAFTTSATTGHLGDSIKLSWEYTVTPGCTPVASLSKGTESYTITGTSGSMFWTLGTPGDERFDFYAVCTEAWVSGSDQATRASVHVDVAQPPPPEPDPSIRLTADRNYINLGQSTTLHWDSTVPSTCANPKVTLTAKDNNPQDHSYRSIIGGLPTNGSKVVTPDYWQLYRADLVCGGGVAASATADVEVHFDNATPVPTDWHCVKAYFPATGICSKFAFPWSSESAAEARCESENPTASCATFDCSQFTTLPCTP